MGFSLIIFFGNEVKQSVALVLSNSASHKQLEHLFHVRKRKRHLGVNNKELDERHHHVNEVFMGRKTS